MKIFTPLPGEYVASALQRGNELLGIRHIPLKDFHIRPMQASSYLGQKSAMEEYESFRFPSLFTENNIAEEVLQNHTLYPLAAALGRTSLSMVVTPASWKKICAICVAEDFEIHGTAYVHRRHVQHYVQVCSIHGCDLLTTCPTCLTPIKKHEISRLGVCSKSYKIQTCHLKSKRHLYSLFVAELLDYKGQPIKQTIAEQTIWFSLHLKYMNELYDNYRSLPAIIMRDFGMSVSNPPDQVMSDRSFAAKAFAGCSTAKRYIELVTKDEASIELEKDFHKIEKSLLRKRKSLRLEKTNKLILQLNETT